MANHTTKICVIAILCAMLAACTNADNTLNVGGNEDADDANVPQIANLPEPPAGGSNVFFAPIIGAPVDKVTSLSQQLTTSAPTANVQLSPGRADNLTHEIRGYFSALSEGSTTTVVHVWDVFTPDGQRVHRIQGQEVVQGTAADAWSVVPSQTMETIARNVLTQYAQWRAAAAA
ncbi:MAG: hypothetical protein AAGI92_05980 [Pseudomonadota bacterium]